VTVHRLRVTHVTSYTYFPEDVEHAWRDGPPIPDYVLAGDEDTSAEARVIAAYQAYRDSLIELFEHQQDDDVSYELLVEADDA
jgi:hypothetical protein